MNNHRLPSHKSEAERKKAFDTAKQKIEQRGWNGKTNRGQDYYKEWMWKGDIDWAEFDTLSNEEIDIIVYEYKGNYQLYKTDKKNGEYKKDRKGKFRGQKNV